MFYVAVTVAAPVPLTLLRDLVSRVCDLCGASEQTADLTRQVEEAVVQAVGETRGGDYELRFRAQDGALDVAVSDRTRQIWHVIRPID